MQESLTLMMLQGVEKILLIRRLAAFAGRTESLLVLYLVDEPILIADVRNDVFKGQPLGILLAPIIERRAHRLGGIESRNVMAAVTAEACDRLSADVPLEFFVADGTREEPFVGVGSAG